MSLGFKFFFSEIYQNQKKQNSRILSNVSFLNTSDMNWEFLPETVCVSNFPMCIIGSIIMPTGIHLRGAEKESRRRRCASHTRRLLQAAAVHHHPQKCTKQS